MTASAGATARNRLFGGRRSGKGEDGRSLAVGEERSLRAADGGRRNVELGLLVMGLVCTAGAYILASLGETASIPANIGPFLGIVVGLLMLAHVANRALASRANPTLFPLAGLLNGLGYVFIARLDGGDRLAGLQATWTGAGIAAYVGTLLFIKKTRQLESYRYTFLVAGLGLLLLPLVPGLGRTVSGARIWVRLGPINFQPGEFAKIALAIFFAAYLVENREMLSLSTFRFGPFSTPDPRHLGPVLVAWGTSLVVMVAERDLGSSLLFFALFMILVWVATQRLIYPITGIALFALGAVFSYNFFGHVRVRFSTWLDPWPDATEGGYQVVQSWFALAWGGITGTGPGLGDPDRVPAASTDFIFAVIGEELGLLGATVVLMSFMIMVGSGLQIALRATNPFDKLLATGLTALLGVQSFIIIAGVIRLLPLTGVTLPFVSYGGSSLVANYVLLALLMRLSHETNSRVVAETGASSTGSRRGGGEHAARGRDRGRRGSGRGAGRTSRRAQ